MKKLLTFVAAIGVLLAVPLAAQEQKEKEKLATPASAEKPAYKLGSVVDEKLVLTDLDGKSMTFKDLRGKVVMIHFWSMTCPFEEVADPKVAALEKRWKDNKDVVVLAIAANSTEIGEKKPADNYAAIREHLKKKGLTNAVYADHGNKLADLFQAKSTPHCFVLDRKGSIVYAGGLDDDPKGDKGEATQQFARDAVEAALSGKEPAVKESKPYGCSIKRIKA
jgi:thiol-disulfide isomerase/thioredoxin